MAMARPVNQELHEARSAAILAAAREQLANEGISGFSLRAIARRLALAPNALYTYFPCIDALITALLVDAFQRFAATLAAAVEPDDTDYARRFAAICAAYRAWAVAHPTDYDLIFGRPIPGYQAPEEVTSPLSLQAFEVGLRVLVEAEQAGQLQPPLRYQHLPPLVIANLNAQPYSGEASATLRFLMLSVWSRLHGLVTLEIHGNAREAIAETGEFFQHNVACLIAEIGLSP
jgi:AcrR family transcriptional regulator